MKLFYTLLLFLAFQQTFAQGTQVEFGKNRVQYRHDFDEWMQYESDNFITYWYGEGRNVGQAAVQLAELDFESIQNILEHRMNDKIEIIVYTDLTDLKQTNIGSEEAFVNTGGQTKIVGNKMFVYFDGNHQHLRRQIREGIATVYLNAMLFGSNLQEIVQNAVLLSLPEWYKQGLISYVSEDWNTDMDNQLRDAVLLHKFKDFKAFAEANPRLAGHSMWYYISQTYGKSSVSNLLYLTRINRSLESGFLYVLGISFPSAVDGWETYFTQRYEEEAKGMTNASKQDAVAYKNKRKLPITQCKLSPDGRQLAYVTNEIGRARVYLQDMATGKRKTILKTGFRNAIQATDYGYPLLSWNPNNQELAIFYERHDVIHILYYTPETDKKEKDVLPAEYQRVFNIEYMNPNQILLSAAVRGFSDLFIFKIKTRESERLTNDFWDDLDAVPVNVENKRGILFASNRQDSTLFTQKLDSILPIQTFDLYYLCLDDTARRLVRVTNTPFANERQPIALDSTWFGYLSDESGIYNRQMGYLKDVIVSYLKKIYLKDQTIITIPQDSTLASLDSTLIDSVQIVPVYKKMAFVHPHSNFDRNILTFQAAPRSNKLIQTVYSNGRYLIIPEEINPEKEVNPYPTHYAESLNKNRFVKNAADKNKTTQAPDNLLEEKDNKAIDVSAIPVTKRDTQPVEADNYMFQSEFDNEEPAKPAPKPVVAEKDESPLIPQQPVVTQDAAEPSLRANGVHQFRQSRIIPYRLKFRTDYVTTQLDNSLLFGGLNSFAGTPSGFETPPLGILLKGNIKDLFEDYEFEGGIRIPTTFNGAEYFLIFDDKKHRIDRRYALYRRTQRYTLDAETPRFQRKARNTQLIGLVELRYPLDIYTSFRVSGTLRFDSRTQLASDSVSLNTPTYREQRMGLKVEYVFDNTLDIGINIKNGTRYKVYAELVKRFQVDIGDHSSFNFGKGFMTVLGLDARHYLRLDKRSVFATRLAAATSFGSEKIIYFLGGVDNWMFASFNNDIPVPASGDYSYMTLASNLRGFQQNIRNGSSFALINAELRVPIFQYFSRKPIQSSFFRNFQLVGFFDIGTAWYGNNPFSQTNPLNTSVISSPNVYVTVNYFRDPLVAGYGAGIRTTIFGYFLRLDYAWGVETRRIQKPLLYLSLGLDF